MTKREHFYHTAAYDLRRNFVVTRDGIRRRILFVRIDGNYTTITWEGGKDEVVRSVDHFTVVSDN